MTQQHRTFWNCQCPCNGTNLGHNWLLRFVCSAGTAGGSTLRTLSLERGSAWIQTLLPHQANEAAVLVEGAGKRTQPCPLSQPNPAQLQKNSGFSRDSAEQCLTVVTECIFKNKGLCFRLALFFSFPGQGQCSISKVTLESNTEIPSQLKDRYLSARAAEGIGCHSGVDLRAVQGGHSDSPDSQAWLCLCATNHIPTSTNRGFAGNWTLKSTF